RHIDHLAESVHTRLVPVRGWTPSEKPEIILSDQTDSANGSATAVPLNTIRLYLTAPDDLSPLGDVDDWYLALLTHEYTHILHADHTTGLAALGNSVLGKSFAPNMVQPHWILEGLAIYLESTRTGGGRLRSSLWNMYLRADVLEHNVASLDQFTNTPRRWPQGNLWYLYGSFFVRWIAETYGEDIFRAVIADYGNRPIAYGVNRSMRRATGRTYEDLYPAWIATLQRDFGAQADAIRARGLREGQRLTHTGQVLQKPRFIPRGTWPSAQGDLLYFVDDAHSTPGLYRLPLERSPQGDITHIGDRELLVRTNGVSTASFTPDGDLVFSSVDYHNNLFAFTDLHKLAAGARSPRGLEGNRVRLTDGFRASDPDVSPDGRRVVFVTNHRGTSYLQVADITDHQGIQGVRALVRSERFDQAYSPRWSPDGTHVVYGVWTRGGYRDLRLVDTRDGTYVELTHDRAIDGGPSFSPDGKWVFYHSDRTGVANVYAREVSTGTVKQVTNVLTGAFQPEVSADGKTLAYVGYTSRGFDLYAMRLDPTRWLEPLP
ncbi:MAG: hypothetical protein WCI05_19495, partial [Myxococcales bacterium]